MTLLEIMIVLAILAIVMGIVVGPRVYAIFVESRGKTTQLKLNKYAYEAYPSWAATHGARCPASLAELNPYMNSNDSTDSWGNPLELTCPPPKIHSAGEDGQKGTADDLVSGE